VARLILASASAARRRLLEAAGIEAEVRVSGVDETLEAGGDVTSAVATLARRKAEAVASLTGLTRAGDGLVLGCDSLLDLDGRALGKPGSAAEATARWRAQRGRVGHLRTGHHLIDLASGRSASGVASTAVRFGWPSDAEIAAYVATGEPLGVAGAFTLDGRGAPFVDGVDGDPANVVGLSLPLLRRLLGELGTGIVELWS